MEYKQGRRICFPGSSPFFDLSRRMKKKILFCIVFILGFIRPINAAKLYTTHWSNKPVVFYIVDTLGRHRNRVIVYPNNQNK